MAERARLEAILADMRRPAVAVSGGVDSVTLAEAARRMAPEARMVHARSPAVPAAATARVERLAAERGWALAIVDAGEFADPDYLTNPVNRCFFCKTNLYRTMDAIVAALAEGGTVCSGANLDDLGDFRPGLDAAREYAVRHPFVEAGFAKADVRALAAALGLGEIAELPASPCLSSRVETGIAITAGDVRLIDAVETALRRALGPRGDVRCRIRRTGIEIELSPELKAEAERQRLLARLPKAVPALAGRPLSLGTYRRGSAFLRVAEVAG